MILKIKTWYFVWLFSSIVVFQLDGKASFHAATIIRKGKGGEKKMEKHNHTNINKNIFLQNWKEKNLEIDCDWEKLDSLPNQIKFININWNYNHY